MAGAIACTMLFAMGGSLPVFTLAWSANRLIQSLGWPGMIKITSRWFSYSRYGTVMGVISLSFLFGDAVARAFMARLIGAGLGWRGVFWVAAGVLAGLWISTWPRFASRPRTSACPSRRRIPATCSALSARTRIPMRPVRSSTRCAEPCLLDRVLHVGRHDLVA